MTKSKPTRSKRRASRADRRERAVTPVQRLKATVSAIQDCALPRPKNCLIGESPSNTICACIATLNWIALVSKPSDLVLADPRVLRSVIEALGHASLDASRLFEAARVATGR